MTVLLKHVLFYCFILLISAILLPPIQSLAQGDVTKIVPANQAPIMIGEKWTGSIYTSTFEAGACFFPDGRVRGVLLVKLSNGQVDTYHFQGTMENDGTIITTHKSGHRFVGKFVDETNISGKVTLSNGFSTTLDGKRLQNVHLNERCGPIAESK